ncbi:MAG: hypothetical protein WB772_07170 [Xanthobacteraceae bacterium]|jgi:hypothetical protein
MPNYTFELRDGSGGIDDESGVALTDGVDALRYAQTVVRELMRSREAQTRTWRLDVYDEAGACVIELPFASIDPTLDHLRPELRAMVEKFCDRRRSVDEMIHTARGTVRESQALVARSRGNLYVAARSGEKTIRDR